MDHLKTGEVISKRRRELGLTQNHLLTILILVIICVTYTVTVYFGMKGVAKLAASCSYLFSHCWPMCS